MDNIQVLVPFLLLALALVVAADHDQAWTDMGTVTELDGGSGGRTLVAAKKSDRYISYDALKKDNVPCKNRGQSYYNCNRRTKANPYNRGCSVITNCKRYTD